jgi:hypothetical protein
MLAGFALGVVVSAAVAYVLKRLGKLSVTL